MTIWAGGEMVDTPVLGTGAARHGGSSPLPPTKLDKTKGAGYFPAPYLGHQQLRPTVDGQLNSH